MFKVLREGSTYSQRDMLEALAEFSAFKDRVTKKFRELAKELEGKPNEHELWVNLYLIAADYAEEAMVKRQRQEVSLQKIS
ncbi:hypothetical protein [Thermodesulfitimonas autotrophica]|uniref:Uncharacterized protein n=1 Tax=Thermodesulfitimonas autotrophica TaxID=1894989 RepID=A0A3N5BIY1_9THEO|nr:hypothetical protein [Thermodesulfitimonas autotrophica]RPF49648.1 hypothetical protein EDD75_0467 [Thermodesulfitimonas autotrophica]